ncbi:MAG: sigma-54 dependent transcriptional regulator [Sneathiellaceae bacterium]
MAKHILIVDDDPTQRRLLSALIERQGFRTMTAGSGEEALKHLGGPHQAEIGLVLLDLVMPGMDGIAVLEQVRPAHPDLPVIVLTAQGGVDTAVKAMRAGANDFVIKPPNPERLRVSIENALKVGALTGQLDRLSRKMTGDLGFTDLIAISPAMMKVLDLARRGGASSIPILIEGESGVGKELIARAIQGTGERAGKAFVTVNCGAIPDNLVESILFGHEKGAFTGAIDKHVGKFQEANGGTLFLDEIGELKPDIQVKLLCALQEGEIDPIGASRPVKVDIRLISATNRNLMDQVAQGHFREDLFYRLNVFPIHVPPLRVRREDIPPLVEHFTASFAVAERKTVTGIADDAMRLLTEFEWPGNVRQLENTIFRAVVLCDGPVLTVADFPQIVQIAAAPAHPAPAAAAPPQAMAIAPAAPPPPAAPPAAPQAGPPHAAPSGTAPPAWAAAPGGIHHFGSPGAGTPPAGSGEAAPVANGSGTIPALDGRGEIRSLEDVESDLIRLALRKYDGQMSEVARRLGIGRSTLYRKVRGLEGMEGI